MTRKRDRFSEDAAVMATIVALMHYRRTGDYLRAAEAHRELATLGVKLTFRASLDETAVDRQRRLARDRQRRHRRKSAQVNT